MELGATDDVGTSLSFWKGVNDGDAGGTGWQSDECVLRGSLLSLDAGEKSEAASPSRQANVASIVRIMMGQSS